MRKEKVNKNAIHHLWKRKIWAISHPTRLHILSELYGCNDWALSQSPLYFTELRDALQIKNSEMTYHLKLLIKAGLVRNGYPKGKRNGNRSSIYKITSKGIEILESLGIPERLKQELGMHTQERC